MHFQAQKPIFHVLAFYSADQEADHATFALQAVDYFTTLAHKDNFEFESTTNWADLNAANLAKYQVVLWLNDVPSAESQRRVFETYMKHGGGWIGFHGGGYNDSSTHWPWFAQFLGAVFSGNSWPPLPATLKIDDPNGLITRGLPHSFLSPANEWYSWVPNPRSAREVRVLLTLSPSNFPLGFKDTLTGGDVPVVWTNTRYRMVYMNMGHGDKVLTSPTQNLLFEHALLWLGSNSR